MSGLGNGVVVLEDDQDDRVPSEEEIREYAEFLGINVDTEPYLMWIARDGVSAPVPHPWKACTQNGDDVFYFNFDTSESSWEHPCDEKFKTLVEIERKKHTGAASCSGSESGQSPNGESLHTLQTDLSVGPEDSTCTADGDAACGSSGPARSGANSDRGRGTMATTKTGGPAVDSGHSSVSIVGSEASAPISGISTPAAAPVKEAAQQSVEECSSSVEGVREVPAALLRLVWQAWKNTVAEHSGETDNMSRMRMALLRLAWQAWREVVALSADVDGPGPISGHCVVARGDMVRSKVPRNRLQAQVESLKRVVSTMKEIRAKQREYLRLLQTGA